MTSGISKGTTRPQNSGCQAVPPTTCGSSENPLFELCLLLCKSGAVVIVLLYACRDGFVMRIVMAYA